ncbi:TPA: hypothetical protein MPW84_001409 [Listeria monocytogenes]|uniref:Uncharacterized protein n=1 Tax=Listeria monocytogenes TaxID=1639 RepID=A0A608N1L6_LISMN|nr:hypothetical protein [Listeria monocytogenes]EAD3237215.1 hypothetical protein [Listeria monocytogenes CFSAN002202]EAF3063984.1 hypothetical protein [Listeria monocytogenes serotype 1/2a]EAF4501994.1 hypothetical protein [Listeria monocytogenes serotype 4b]EAG6360943.1 hypothetical protein [Listeria monocytogenes CFSAN002351]EAG9424707.1 hypothetical protein [Listeria monocytogenes CFSAN002184]ECT1641346.1 hypothetical protein [Listeria monocytogenes CFSAN002191]EHC6165247.1 hypothetical 
MKKLTVGGKFDWYIDTLEKSGMFILELSNEEIETFIFEDFIVGVTSFFSKNNLSELKANEIIDEDMEKNTYLLREKVLKIDNTDLWNINSVRQSSEWLDIFRRSDELKRQLKERWSDEEIEYLKTL